MFTLNPEMTCLCTYTYTVNYKTAWLRQRQHLHQCILYCIYFSWSQTIHVFLYHGTKVSEVTQNSEFESIMFRTEVAVTVPSQDKGILGITY